MLKNAHYVFWSVNFNLLIGRSETKEGIHYDIEKYIIRTKFALCGIVHMKDNVLPGYARDNWWATTMLNHFSRLIGNQWVYVNIARFAHAAFLSATNHRRFYTV